MTRELNARAADGQGRSGAFFLLRDIAKKKKTVCYNITNKNDPDLPDDNTEYCYENNSCVYDCAYVHYAFRRLQQQ